MLDGLPKVRVQLCVRVCTRVRACMCVCVCVRACLRMYLCARGYGCDYSSPHRRDFAPAMHACMRSTAVLIIVRVTRPILALNKATVSRVSEVCLPTAWSLCYVVSVVYIGMHGVSVALCTS